MNKLALLAEAFEKALDLRRSLDGVDGSLRASCDELLEDIVAEQRHERRRLEIEAGIARLTPRDIH